MLACGAVASALSAMKASKGSTSSCKTAKQCRIANRIPCITHCRDSALYNKHKSIRRGAEAARDKPPHCGRAKLARRAPSIMLQTADVALMCCLHNTHIQSHTQCVLCVFIHKHAAHCEQDQHTDADHASTAHLAQLLLMRLVIVIIL